MAHYCHVKSTNCSITNLSVSDGYSYANVSIQPNSILNWPFVLLEQISHAPNREYRRKQWASPWVLRDFDVVFSASFRLLFSVLMTVDMFAWQSRRPMSRHQLWCVPWMWDQNWRDPAWLKRPAYGTVFEENLALFEQAMWLRVSCPKYSTKSNQQTSKWHWGHESFVHWKIRDRLLKWTDLTSCYKTNWLTDRAHCWHSNWLPTCGKKDFWKIISVDLLNWKNSFFDYIFLYF